MSNAYHPTALQEAQRLRVLAAAEALGHDRAWANGALRSAMKAAPRGERYSTTFRKCADRLEALVKAAV